MKKVIPIGMVLVLMLFLLPSCAVGVSQEEYDRVSSDLAAAQTEIQSLETDLSKAQVQNQSLRGDLTIAQVQIESLESDKEVAEEKLAEALAYAEFELILMYPVCEYWGIISCFEFEDDLEWLAELKNRASDMEDVKLSNYIKELERIEESMRIADPVFAALSDYCVNRLEQALK